MVEQGVFPKDPVLSILSSKYVEARLHTDLPVSHERYKFNERIQGIRAHFLGEGNIGLPYYIIVDPDEAEVSIAKRAGYAEVSVFEEFLSVDTR